MSVAGQNNQVVCGKVATVDAACSFDLWEREGKIERELKRSFIESVNRYEVN